MDILRVSKKFYLEYTVTERIRKGLVGSSLTGDTES